MPKVYLLEEERKTAALKRFIYGQGKALKITQQSIADKLDINRATLARKVDAGALTYKELLQVFKLLQADEATINELMRF